MLGNRLKKELREGNWEKYTKEYANYYELIKRNKSKIKDAMTDIELLARKLPDCEQEKLFDNQIIEKMI